MLALYEEQEDSLVQLAFDDDSGDARDARIVQQLAPETNYYLEVQDLFGEPGLIDLFVNRVISVD